MEHDTIIHEDYLRCDKVWQRVAPELDPYPEVRAAAAGISPPAKEGALCCSLAQKQEDAEGIRRLIEQELADRRAYLEHMRCAPGAGPRRVLRQVADEEGAHARRLMGLYYMITGRCCRPALCTASVQTLPWCTFLRGRYAEECAGGYAYHRAAEETEDACLRRILERFSADEYRHAELMLRLLEGNLPTSLA